MNDIMEYRPVCDLCHDPLPENMAPYHRNNREAGECMCFVSSDGGQWDD